jgi:anti-sigma factor RsiW
MIPYVSCEHARDLLEGYLDGELAVDDQVAVEAHLRWCRECAAHVDDLRVIGASVRGVPGTCVTSDDAYALASVQAGVLARVRAERDQAFLARIRATFSDTRMVFPALGATLALVLCFTLTYSVQVTASSELTELLLTKGRRYAAETRASYGVVMLEPTADPGSDQNPLRLDDAFATPQLLNRALAMNALQDITEDEAGFTLAAVVTRKGRIENYELLRTSADGQRFAAANASNVDSVLSAVRQSRFAPAQAHDGGAVAVNMVWLIYKTSVAANITAKPAAAAVRPAPPVVAAPPVVNDLAPAAPGRSGTILDSTVA